MTLHEKIFAIVAGGGKAPSGIIEVLIVCVGIVVIGVAALTIIRSGRKRQ
jgi:hypothetical protein